MSNRKTIIPPSPVSLGDVIIAVKVEPQPPNYGLLIRDGVGVIEAPNGHVHSRVQIPYPLNVPLLVREAWCWVMYDHAHDLLEGRRENRQSVFKSEMHPDWMEYAKERYGYKWKSPATMRSRLARFTLTFHSVEAMQYKDRPEGTISKPMQPDEWAFVYRGIVTLIEAGLAVKSEKK